MVQRIEEGGDTGCAASEFRRRSDLIGPGLDPESSSSEALFYTQRNGGPVSVMTLMVWLSSAGVCGLSVTLFSRGLRARASAASRRRLSGASPDVMVSTSDNRYSVHSKQNAPRRGPRE